MSAAKRAVEQRHRQRRFRRRGGNEASFAWLPGALLLYAASCAFSSAALQLFLLLHASWRPGGAGRRGEAFVSYRRARDAMGRGGTTVKRAFEELSAAGLIGLARPGTRPGGPGGAAGLAAVWHLPSRDMGRPLPPLRLPPGVVRPRGAVRWHCERIRADVRALSPIALKLLVYCVGRPHRDRHGTVEDPTPFRLPQRETAALLGVSAGAVNGALRELVVSGRLRLATIGKGSRASTYTLATAYATHRRRDRADLERELEVERRRCETQTPLPGVNAEDGMRSRS